ncbi:hypothetical protein R1sor_018009 [Riccia sorocarpa]|uniref:RRM domain-containing protein n=1 Tax=Riccia sorocarpa TaxID=122646 RepID=A0ABD3ICI9_9MARC
MPANNQATLYIGNLDERVDERLVYEIMIQAGPVLRIYIPRDKESKRHKGYGFAEYESAESAQYALNLFSGLVSFYNRPVHFGIASGGEKKFSQGFEVGNLEQTTIGGEKASSVGLEPERLISRLPTLRKQRPLLMESEDSGQITPSAGREVQSYRPLSCSHTSNSQHGSYTVAGYGDQEMMKTENFLTSPSHAHYYSAHLAYLSQRANLIGHAYAQPTSFAR